MSRILIAVLIVAAALLLLYLFRPKEPIEPQPPKPSAQAELIEQGRFVLEQRGTKLGQEDFTLEKEPDGTVRLSSKVTLTLPGQELKLKLELLLNAELEPLSYRGEVHTPQGVQHFGAEIEGRSARLYAQAGIQTQEKTFTSDELFVLYDNNQNGQLLILYEHIKDLREGEEARFRALAPQVLMAVPLRVKRDGYALITADGQEREVERFSLKLGGIAIEMYVEDGRVLGSRVPSQAGFFYRADLFPNGFRVLQRPSGQALASEPSGVQEIEITFESDVKLSGTLALPEGLSGRVPAVLLIGGSGPVDRDENAPGLHTEIFKTITHHLARWGIASLRYDKRGVGRSEGDLSKASFTDLVEDARAALAFLRARPEVDPQRIFVLGHSEGGNIAPLLAAEDPELAGMILIATNAHPLDWIIRWQVETLNRAAGVSEEQLAQILKQQDEWAAFVKASRGDWEDYPFEKLRKVLKWLTPEKYDELKRTSLRWLREHFNRDPLETLRKVKAPVLIIQGTKDAQVPPEEAHLLAKTLREAGNAQVELHILKDLNHLLRRHPEEPNLQYRHLDEPVDGRVLEALTSWLEGR